jgi:hypothetical protein
MKCFSCYRKFKNITNINTPKVDFNAGNCLKKVTVVKTVIFALDVSCIIKIVLMSLLSTGGFLRPAGAHSRLCPVNLPVCV